MITVAILRYIVELDNMRKKTIRLSVILVFLSIFLFFFKPVYIPSYNIGNKLPIGFIYKCAYSNNSPKTGDIVSLKYAGGSVVALAELVANPNDEIQIEDNNIMVNNKLYKTGNFRSKTSYKKTKLKSHEHFVLIYDSQFDKISDFGKTSKNRLLGKLYAF